MGGTPPGKSPDLLLYFGPPTFILLWASGFVVARYGTPYSPALKFLAVRFGLATLSFLAWALVSRAKWPQSSNVILHLLVVGLLTYGGCLSCVWTAIRLGIGAGLPSLITAMQPVLTTIFMALRGTKILTRQWVGMLVAAIGLVLVLWQKFGTGEVTATNVILTFIGLFCITGGGLYQKAFLTAPVDVRTAQFFQQLAACLFTIPFALAETGEMEWHYPDSGEVNWSLIGSIVFCVIVVSLGAASLLFMMIQRGAVNVVTSQMFLVPPTTAVLAYLCFNEPVPPLAILGIVLTVVGVAFVVKPPLPACIERAWDRSCGRKPGKSADVVADALPSTELGLGLPPVKAVSLSPINNSSAVSAITVDCDTTSNPTVADRTPKAL